MININRLYQLEKEVQDTHDQIIRQVWLVPHIIGKDTKSDRDVLIDIDMEVEETSNNQSIPRNNIFTTNKESKKVVSKWVGSPIK